ncbi:MAG: polysaccharide deacetylase family protein [Dactylosporangium sp.]|nr:polysaccharide deacetylase family protein [Dactylosporangium sp.]NNJ59723.1 polysaccharide deacetylase family protein [Dactylosporangium sp.]
MVGLAFLVLAGSVSAAPQIAASAVGGNGDGDGTKGRNAALAVADRSRESDRGLKRTKPEPTPSSPAKPTAQPSPSAATPQPPELPGSATPQPVRPLRNIGGPKVALTFDDGPDTATPEILALLRQHGVQATFCVIGTSVQDHHDLVRQIVADGHTLCNHTWSHNLKLGQQSPADIRHDLQRTSDEIHLATPNAPIKYFRHPGGNFTPEAIAVAHELGMTSIGWEVDPRDWDVRTYGTGASMGGHVIEVVMKSTRPGSIVLSHDGGGQRSGTVHAYQTLLPWLLERYELVALPV